MHIRTVRDTLRKLGCWEQFKQNVHQNRRTLKKVCEVEPSTPEVVLGAFEWSCTPEGCTYWSKIHNKCKREKT